MTSWGLWSQRERARERERKRREREERDIGWSDPKSLQTHEICNCVLPFSLRVVVVGGGLGDLLTYHSPCWRCLWQIFPGLSMQEEQPWWLWRERERGFGCISDSTTIILWVTGGKILYKWSTTSSTQAKHHITSMQNRSNTVTAYDFTQNTAVL